ncbi:hypothetical protein [Vibrio coralliirubri]|nr:hypothetical protein [Vibrio coralliirubri]
MILISDVRVVLPAASIASATIAVVPSWAITTAVYGVMPIS